MKNIARILEIEDFMSRLVQRAPDEYLFVQEQTINSFEEDSNQNLVNAQILYKRFSINN